LKLLFDENLSPKLALLFGDLFPGSESALKNGLMGAGDRAILAYAVDRDFILVSTDMDFESLLKHFPTARIVILRACNYPTGVAVKVLQRNAIRIAESQNIPGRLLILNQ
jgi:predicted nuclease of predicted toxin-antitoxin system